MTHITQYQANELVEQLRGVEGGQEYVLALCNAAIDHYRNSLSAELPEPVGYVYGVMTDGCVRRSMANIKAGIELPSGEALHARDQLLSALAARDAHHRSLRNAYEQQTLTLAQQDDEERAELKAQADRLADANDKLFLQLQTMQAERDAALQDAKRWAKMRDLFTTLGVDYYYLEGRSAEEITEWVDGKGKV